MLFKKNIDIYIDENIIKKNRVPILTKDRVWKDIIGANTSKSIQSLSNRLEELLEEEKKLKIQLKDNKQQKTKLMNKIIHLSNLLNSKGQENVLPEMERCKEEIEKINEAIDVIMEKLEEYPKEIEKINLALLKETIIIVYSDINTSQNRLFTVKDEIDELRAKLNSLREEKDLLEEKIELLYSFLHTVVGHEEMEKLDLRFLKE